MNRDQAYLNNVSLKLSEVLCDIGVNEQMVLKRRRMFMLIERMQTIGCSMTGLESVSYFFGSQSEGTTTLGLCSDYDTLFCHSAVNVIQDWSQWRPGVWNLLMIQDETTSPGYCLLQELRDDVPLPLTEQNPLGQTGKVLIKNTIFSFCKFIGLTIHGPAQSLYSQPDLADQDLVIAFLCKAWPAEAQPWLERQGIGGWPTEEMKRYCMNSGCFLVPVSSKSGQNNDTEWRISTSLAERILVYCMNITQIRCYVLMKMILKTFINPQCNDVISSYMCKTVLFHCVQNTPSQQWQENNLLPCLTECLLKLQHFITEENCPHFIILENNLLSGKISDLVKHQLLEILQHIIQSEGRVLLEIQTDNLGARLHDKMNNILIAVYLTPNLLSSIISGGLLMNTAHFLDGLYREHLQQVMCSSNDSAHVRLSGFISALAEVYSIPDVSCTSMLDKSICELLLPLLCSTLGSVIASADIRTNNTISPQALEWFSAGLNSDVSSGRLKLASALYCSGDMESTDIVLRTIEDQYDEFTVTSVCRCSYCINQPYNVSPGQMFNQKCSTGNEELIKQVSAFCVRFTECEKDCVPKELQYEMFWTREESRRDCLIPWIAMDLTVVASLPYLYFLQYKTYGHLQRPAGQQCALTYLATTINKGINLHHPETALNLLGQCMEQENRYNDALHCYVRSLNIRARNNAAKIHICRLLNSLVNRHLE